MNKFRAAVLDVGSNTIKILVGESTENGAKILLDRTAEVRISAGMYGSPPQFTIEAIQAAVAAIEDLLQLADAYQPNETEILATSAVRDAENREAFLEMVHQRTGHIVTVLSGREEACGIADGIAQEPMLSLESPQTVTDLGGGSLEWIARTEGVIDSVFSFELGAVKLMERFLKNPSARLDSKIRTAIRAHCRKTFTQYIDSNLIPKDAVHWGTGGAFTISRLLLATENSLALKEQPAELSVRNLSRIEEALSGLNLAEREHYPGLPATRADILPIALNIILALGEFMGASSFHHSFYNLRMGRLAKLLATDL